MPTPNQGPFPSSPTNNPEIWPFLNLANGEMLMLSTVPEETEIGNVQMGMMNTPQGPRNLLMAMRTQFPYLPIVPVPNHYRSILLASNTAQEIAIPSHIVCGMILTSGDVYMSTRGNAAIPSATETESIYKPDRIMFYLAGCKAISFISANANTPVTFMGYSFTELPR